MSHNTYRTIRLPNPSNLQSKRESFFKMHSGEASPKNPIYYRGQSRSKMIELMSERLRPRWNGGGTVIPSEKTPIGKFSRAIRNSVPALKLKKKRARRPASRGKRHERTGKKWMEYGFGFNF